MDKEELTWKKIMSSHILSNINVNAKILTTTSNDLSTYLNDKNSIKILFSFKIFS